MSSACFQIAQTLPCCVGFICCVNSVNWLIIRVKFDIFCVASKQFRPLFRRAMSSVRSDVHVYNLLAISSTFHMTAEVDVII